MGPPYLDPPDGETQISEMGPTRVEFNKLSSLLNSTQKFEQSLRKETNLGKKLPTLKAKPKPSKLCMFDSSKIVFSVYLYLWGSFLWALLK